MLNSRAGLSHKVERLSDRDWRYWASLLLTDGSNAKLGHELAAAPSPDR